MVKKITAAMPDAVSSKAAVIISRTANDFIQNATAPSTLRAYATDIRSWKAWCKLRDRPNFQLCRLMSQILLLKQHRVA
jgi:hypothetical protein